MRDDLREFARLDAVIEGLVEIVGKRRCLVARDQGSDRDDAAVARREAGTLPYLAVKALLGVLLEGRRNPPDVVR